MHSEKTLALRREMPNRSGRLIETHSCNAAGGAEFAVSGELRAGALRIGLVENGAWKVYRDVVDPGPFRLQLPISTGWVKGVVAYHLDPVAPLLDVGIGQVEFGPGAAAPDRVAPTPVRESGSAALDEESSARISPLAPANLLVRLSDWFLFGKPIFANATTLLFGQEKPLDRSVRTSAHNYFIDMAFNFGLLGLVPVISLLGLTLRRAFAVRRGLLGDPALTGLLVAVLFFVLIDSSFKVTLRQPYPGLVAFFLWGALLAQLRRLAGSSRDPGQLRR
jgi:hypothetical protein